MRGDRTFTSQSCFFFTRRFKKCWQLFDSLLTHNWKDNGVRKDLCGVWGCFRSCRRRSTGADIRPWTRLHGNYFDVEGWWACLRFIVSCVFPFEWPTKMSDKESTTKRTAQGNEMVGLDGSSSRQQCWTGTTLSDMARRTWDVAQELRI